MHSHRVVIRRLAMLGVGWCWLAGLLVAGAPAEVLATWERLPSLVEKRDIETVLLNGVQLRGRVEKVLPDALEVWVKRTSDPNLVPKGRARVSRRLVSAFTVESRQGGARIALGVAGFLGLPVLLGFSGLGPEMIGAAGYFGIAAVGAILGYVIGAILILTICSSASSQSLPRGSRTPKPRAPEVLPILARRTLERRKTGSLRRP
ncbi:MAG: hypothetical protein NZM33_00060 [Bryobacteraceae bacterium]|nr:hypothetical protein [Bryobacteraceae bacterium]